MAALLNRLPIELLDEVLCYIMMLGPRWLSHFSMTCWLYYNWGTPLLYKNITLQTYRELRIFRSAFEHELPKRLLLPAKVSQKLNFLRTVLRRHGGGQSPTRPSPLLYTKHIYVASRRWNDPLTDEKLVLRAAKILRHAYPNVQTLCLGSTIHKDLTVKLCKGWPASRLMLATEFHHHEKFFPPLVNKHDSLPNITHLFVPNISGTNEFLPGGAAKRFPNLTHLAFSCKPYSPAEARQIVATVLALLAKRSWHLSRLLLLVIHRRDANPRATPLWRELVDRVRDPRVVAVGIVATQVEGTGLHDCTIPLVDQWTMLVQEGDEFWETGQQVFEGPARV